MLDYEPVPPYILDIEKIEPCGFNVSEGAALLALTLKDGSVMVVDALPSTRFFPGKKQQLDRGPFGDVCSVKILEDTP